MPPAGSGNHSAFCEGNTVFRSFADGVLRDFATKKMIDATCCGIAPGMVIVDPLMPAFQNWTLNNVLRAQLTNTPSMAGICMDRTDHAGVFRPFGDDGVSWNDELGGTVSFLATGWKQLKARMADLLHSYNKALFISFTQNRRLDLCCKYVAEKGRRRRKKERRRKKKKEGEREQE